MKDNLSGNAVLLPFGEQGEQAFLEAHEGAPRNALQLNIMFNARAYLLVLSVAGGLAAFAACSPKQPHNSSTTVQSDDHIQKELDARRGRALFAANCAACHGAGGLGGPVGPSLHNEKTRKSLQETQAWIKDPQPPMPKLYPGSLSGADVGDLAAYVQTL